MKLATFCAAAVMGGFLSACGGGGEAAPSQAGATQQGPFAAGTAGIYDVNFKSFSGVYTLLENGDLWGVHFVGGSVLAGYIHAAGTVAGTGFPVQSLPWAIFIDGPDGSQYLDGMFGRALVPEGMKVSLGMGAATLSSVITRQRPHTPGSAKTLYGDALPLATLAGSYQGLMRSVGFYHPQEAVSDLSISASGVLTASAAGCTFTGSVLQHGASGVYDATATPSGAACRSTAAMRGVLTPMEVSAGRTMLALQLNNVDLHAAVFIVTKN